MTLFAIFINGIVEGICSHMVMMAFTSQCFLRAVAHSSQCCLLINARLGIKDALLIVITKCCWRLVVPQLQVLSAS